MFGGGGDVIARPPALIPRRCVALPVVQRVVADGRVELQVHDENQEARRYYRRLGMRVTRWRESPDGPLRAEGESLYEPAKGCRITAWDEIESTTLELVRHTWRYVSAAHTVCM